MTTGDPLLDAILANPDDDAPRLVWADREGGERGELVSSNARSRPATAPSISSSVSASSSRARSHGGRSASSGRAR